MRTTSLSVGLSLVFSIGFAANADSASIESVEAFRAARDGGDYPAARALLSDDPRVWYDGREGEGHPVKLGEGRWKVWDDHFNSTGEVGPWTVDGDTVWAVADETNDYFHLLERRDTPRYRISYFFDEAGKIEGYMISAAEPDAPARPRQDRFEEFETWAIAHHPEEWRYLRPGGELDPTGDRASRTRRLLEMWRAEVGLPPLNP